MPWQFGKASDLGGREEQQDRVDILSVADSSAHLLVLADGMGGHLDGSLAAQSILDTAQRLFDGRVEDPDRFLAQLCLECHAALGDIGGSGARSAGSTCVLLYLNGDEAHWAHVGDSRLYLFRGGELIDRTFDHSLRRLMIERGRIQETDFEAAELQSQLYMRLGGEQQPKPDLGSIGAKSGDLFMLCSDGLWGRVEPEEALAGLAGRSPQQNAEYLAGLARARGGADGDNISLAFAYWPTPEPKRGLLGTLFGGRKG
jgi:serine/threonine protein phosphatase PrpC